ncbi:MAG: lysophospholipid acyltransferase family protein [Chitinophagales bacterium]|nr:lysophospholipid acyltransferase family protein [Chitinophagales bacterium]
MSNAIYNYLIRPIGKVNQFFLYKIKHPILYFLIITIGRYRREVITKNLKASFPELSGEEIKHIRKKFHHHIIDLLIEGYLMLVLSEKTLLRKYSFTNPELINRYYDEGKSVILVGGHYNNWEYLVVTINKQFKHLGSGIGKKISNRSFGKVMDKRRSRLGTQIWNANNVREKFKEQTENGEPFCCLILADQSVHNVERSFWMKFLNQDTPVLYGLEKLARKYNLPVVYYSCKKVKRGIYESKLELITENPTEEGDGDIVFRYNKMLERDINAAPEYWLWSHKRWKHSKKRPTGMTVREE